MSLSRKNCYTISALFEFKSDFSCNFGWQHLWVVSNYMSQFIVFIEPHCHCVLGTFLHYECWIGPGTAWVNEVKFFLWNLPQGSIEPATLDSESSAQPLDHGGPHTVTVDIFWIKCTRKKFSVKIAAQFFGMWTFLIFPFLQFSRDKVDSFVLINCIKSTGRKLHYKHNILSLSHAPPLFLFLSKLHSSFTQYV